MGAFFTASSRSPASVGQRRAAYLAHLRAEQADLSLAVRRLRNSKPDYSPAQLDRIVASGLAELDDLSAQARAHLERLSYARLQAYRAHRAFQDEHGLTAPAKAPDILSTLLVLMICGLAEAAFTAVLMITGGKMTILEGFGYGATVACVNLAVGTLAGFLPLRYAAFKRNSPSPQPRDSVIRAVAWASFALVLFVLTLLHFAAARVRVTGSATGIFDFSQASFGATFADYYALGVMAIGAVGAVLAVYKGYNGFSDPVPGYSDSRRSAGERIDADGQDACADALDALAFLFAQRSEEAETLLADAHGNIQAYADEGEALAHRIATHNGLIETACDDLLLAAQDAASRQSFVLGERQEHEPLRLEELRALTLPDVPDTLPALTVQAGTLHTDAFTRLQTAHDRAASVIRAGFSAFLTDLTRFDFTPRTKEKNDESIIAPPAAPLANGTDANRLVHTARR